MKSTMLARAGLIPLPSAEDIANFIESNGLTFTTSDITRHFLGKDTVYSKKKIGETMTGFGSK